MNVDAGQLGQYGALGVATALLLWMTRALFARQLRHLDAAQKFQEEQTKVMQALHSEVQELRSDVRDNHQDLLERLEMRRTPVHGMRAQGSQPRVVVPPPKGRNER